MGMESFEPSALLRAINFEDRCIELARGYSADPKGMVYTLLSRVRETNLQDEQIMARWLAPGVTDGQ